MDQMDGSDRAPKDRDPLDLFLKQRSDILRYVTMITGDTAMAEDVVQDSWVRFKAAADKQMIHEPRRFLFRIARNLALDGLRRRSLEEKLFAHDSAAAASIASGEPGAERSVEAASELSYILAAVAKLPERMRRAFLMHRVEGMTLVEIGLRLNISKSVAHELIVDAVEHCRRMRGRGG